MAQETAKLQTLRKLMGENKIEAYIIPHNDAHSVLQSPYTIEI